MNEFPEKTKPSSDWMATVKRYAEAQGDELELADLRAGDRLQVKTRHTLYELLWMTEGEVDAVLQTDRPDRASGKVRVMGCAVGQGSTIAPDRLFTGGSLEFTSGEGKWVHRTSSISWIRMIRDLRG